MKVQCWLLLLPILAVTLVACQKADNKKAAEILESIGVATPPASDITEDTTTPPSETTTDPNPTNPTDEAPPPVENPPSENEDSEEDPETDTPEWSRFQFHFTEIRVWSYLEQKFTACPRIIRNLKRESQTCFKYLGEIYAPTLHRLKEIRFSHDRIKLYWEKNKFRTSDTLYLNHNRSQIDVITQERSLRRNSKTKLGNIWLFKPLIFENQITNTFNGRVEWDSQNRIFILYGTTTDSIKVFSY